MLETVVAAQGASEAVLSSGVQEALGALVGAAREGLMALSVGVGLGVLAELMEEEVTEVVGPKGRHDPGRVAVRHGHDDGEVTLGGRRVPVERPRVRATDGAGEVPVSIYQHFASTDVMSRVVLERVLASVSMRRYQTTNEPVGSDVEAGERSTSKSAVSRMFIERTRTALAELMARRLDDVRLAVLMLDGIDLKERTHIVALGITTEGVKIPLGLWEGSTENATVATALLADLVERGLDPEQAILFVLDGAKALRKAVRSVFGEAAAVQRCIRHKERNVTDHLAERDRPALKKRLRAAWALDRHPPAAEGDLPALVAVAHGGALGVVAAPGADDLGDLLLHQLGQDAQADAHREGQKALLGDPHQLPERLLDARGQRVLTVRDGLLSRYVSLHGGSSFDLGRSPRTLPAAADRAGGPPSSSSTGYGTTSGRAPSLPRARPSQARTQCRAAIGNSRATEDIAWRRSQPGKRGHISEWEH